MSIVYSMLLIFSCLPALGLNDDKKNNIYIENIVKQKNILSI